MEQSEKAKGLDIRIFPLIKAIDLKVQLSHKDENQIIVNTQKCC